MPTDRELAEQAEQHFKATTVSYPEWKRRVAAGKYTPKDGSATEWGKAFATLDQVGVETPTDPPPDPPTDPPPPTGATISGSECSRRASVAGAVIENVTVTGGCDVTAQNVTLRNVTLSDTVKFTPQANGGKLLNSRAKGFYIFGADNIVIEGCVLDARGTDNVNIMWDEPAGNAPENFVIRNNTIRNVYDESDTSSHNEAIYVGFCKSGVIEGNTFTNNGNTAHLFFTNFGNQFNSTSYPRDICVKGNTFGPTHGAYFDVNFGGNVTQVGPTVATIKVDPDNVMPHGITNPEFVRDC